MMSEGLPTDRDDWGSTIVGMHLDSIDGLIENAYPYPIAIAMRQLKTKAYWYEKTKPLTHILETLLKHLAYISMAEYLNIKSKSDLISQFLSESLKQTSSSGKYVDILRTLHHFFEVHQIELFMPELNLFWNKRGKGKARINENKFTELLNIRNAWIHPETGVDKPSREDFERFDTILTELFKSLDFLVSYSMIQVDQKKLARNGPHYRCKMLHGLSLQFTVKNVSLSTQQELYDDVAYLIKTVGNNPTSLILSLFPFYCLRQAPTGIRIDTLKRIKKNKAIWSGTPKEGSSDDNLDLAAQAVLALNEKLNLQTSASTADIPAFDRNPVPTPQPLTIDRPLSTKNTDPKQYPRRLDEKFKFTATHVKQWYQYQCERQIVYDALPKSRIDELAIKHNMDNSSAWADFGIVFEEQVIQKLISDGVSVLSPKTTDALSAQELKLFLKGQHAFQFAYQAKFESITPLMKASLALPENAVIGNVKPDLIRLDKSNGRSPHLLTIIDIKASQRVTLFHKAQVAFYTLILKAIIKTLPNEEISVSEWGEIWHLDDSDDDAAIYRIEAFELKSYENIVIDFFKNHAARFCERHVDIDFDNTFFHIYYKCENCKYFQGHCEQSIRGESPDDWDVSAVAGVTQESKRTLNKHNIFSLSDLHQHLPSLIQDSAALNWSFRTRAKDLALRTQALRENKLIRHTDRYSWLMPPQTDLGIYLLADFNPIHNHLLSLGCLIQWPDGKSQEIVAVIENASQEREALLNVLGQAIAALAEADRTCETRQWQAHIFLYEPTEAQDLQNALQRQLGDQQVSQLLLQMLRIFPPTPLVPEPEYKGAHHLPATAVKSVLSQMYALPVTVAYDLNRASQAIAKHVSHSPTAHTFNAYFPSKDFARPFSSRLSLDVQQRFLTTTIKGDQVTLRMEIEQDVSFRLATLRSIVSWLQDENAAAAEAFLVLKKEPFRFKASFNPLRAADLDVLMAQQLLENRSQLLNRLVSLAFPFEQRRDRLECMSGLELIDSQKRGYHYYLRFSVPQESRHADIDAKSFGLILTQDQAEYRLNPETWKALEISVDSFGGCGERDEIIVKVYTKVFDSDIFQSMLAAQQSASKQWCIDKIYLDFNTERLVKYLRYLGGENP